MHVVSFPIKISTRVDRKCYSFSFNIRLIFARRAWRSHRCKYYHFCEIFRPKGTPRITRVLHHFNAMPPHHFPSNTSSSSTTTTLFCSYIKVTKETFESESYSGPVRVLALTDCTEAEEGKQEAETPAEFTVDDSSWWQAKPRSLMVSKSVTHRQSVSLTDTLTGS